MEQQRTTNDGVVYFFTEGVSAQNHKGTFHAQFCGETGGFELYSYNLKIAHRTADGTVVVGDFSAGGGEYHSQTTSCHVGLAKRIASTVMLPELFRKLYGFEVPF